MGKKYVMALDAGTTSNRCILFDKKGDHVQRGTAGISHSIFQSQAG